MALLDFTPKVLSQQIGTEIPDVYVLIAKHSVMEMDSSTIAEILGVEIAEVQEIEEDETYKQVRLILAAEYARGVSDTDASWDKVEETALKNLIQRMQYEKDPDFNLKVAAMANRAQRRQTPTNGRVIDPASGGHKVALSLSQRIIERLNSSSDNRQAVDRMVETKVSVIHGSHENPKFEDIDGFLGVSRRQPARRDIDGTAKVIEEPVVDDVTLTDMRSLLPPERTAQANSLTLAERLLAKRSQR